MSSRPWQRLAALACALVLAGCGSFERDWKQATLKPAPAGSTADPFAGPWDGQWTSEKHRLPTGPAGGRLRCLFTQVDAHHYQARFMANWLFFSTSYEVTFETKRRAGTLDFRGEHDLGAIFGGVYRYRGHVTPQHFGASFASGYDYGQFNLSRPNHQ